MPIWSSEINELERRYESFKGQLPELEKELVRLIKSEDENIILLYSRRCLEVIITDLCKCELKRERGTEPLKGIIDKLNKEKKVPYNIITSMDHLNSLSTFGTHPKDFDPEQVKPVLVNLDIIIKWYLKYRDTQVITIHETTEVKDEKKASNGATEITQKPKKRLVLLLSGGALVVAVVIVALFFFDIIGAGNKNKELEKSIAVLPFKYLSDETGKQYLADGIMDEILLNLSKIEALRVLSRTSVEQYRETEKTATEICQDLGVSYLLEGSFLKTGEQVRLIVQLITSGKEGHVWAKNYDRTWQDIFNVQSEVAKLVAGELQALIAPKEKQRIEKPPTANIAAYEIYLRANTKRDVFIKKMDQPSFEAAVELYNLALDMDSTFARAYSGLAFLYANRYSSETYFEGSFFDTVLVLCNKAISYDDQVDEAYLVRGNYYGRNGNFDKAFLDIDKALEINPNYYDAYRIKGFGLIRFLRDYQHGIENYLKALRLIYGEERTSILNNLIFAYTEIGIVDLATDMMEEKLKLDGDSASWLSNKAWIEFGLENFEEAYAYRKKAAKFRQADFIPIDYFVCLPSAYKDIYYEYVLKLVKRNSERNQLPLQSAHRIGYGFYQVGKKDEAERYFKMQIQYSERSIRLGRYLSQWGASQYDLAATCAFTGNTEKAYKYLNEFSKQDKFPLWWVSLLKHDPLFNSLHDEPEFQEIVNDVEAKYQAEHERVRKWLEENDMLEE